MARITPAELEATKVKLAAINRRAIKRGFTGRIELDAQRVELKSTDEYGFDRLEVWYDVSLTGEPPSYQGWSFVATLSWDEHAGLVVRTAPGSDPIRDRDRLQEDFCDHCRLLRRRIRTYLVHNQETGEQLQVGSTCLKDFLGWAGHIVFLSDESVTKELGFGSYQNSCDAVGTEYALAVAWALIKLDGYKPASSFGSTTKGDVGDVLWPPRSMTMQRREELARIQGLADQAINQAALCRAWVLSDDFAGPSDYVANLKAVAGADYVTGANIGILASAPQAWAKWQDRTLVRSSATSEWIGHVADRVTFTATINSIHFLPSDWGTRVLYVMRDAAGNVIKWFASREALGDVTGEEVTLKATITELSEYKGVKQTIVTRAKEVIGS